MLLEVSLCFWYLWPNLLAPPPTTEECGWNMLRSREARLRSVRLVPIIPSGRPLLPPTRTMVTPPGVWLTLVFLCKHGVVPLLTVFLIIYVLGADHELKIYKNKKPANATPHNKIFKIKCLGGYASNVSYNTVHT